MTTLEAFILGIIQGITEFLPVSSSGHLELGQYFLGFSNLHNYIFFDLVCHLGTLFSLLIVFYTQIKDVIVSDRTRLIQIIVATLPLFPLVLVMKPIKAMFDEPQYLGYCFIFTALILYLGIRAESNVRVRKPSNSWRDALIIGLFQAVAILPGISRSGATISAGRMLGWRSQDAITFSFLLAIPAILGGVALELINLLSGKSTLNLTSMGWTEYSIGFLSSFIMGYFALVLLMKLATKNKFLYFVWYCLLVGISTLIYFNF